MAPRAGPILIAGAGIAGLTVALALAQRGFEVQIFERSKALRAIGAGVQLSPNATRILDRLGVLPLLEPMAVRPPAIVLRNAQDLREIARVALGEDCANRWGAPYIVVHRADLQAALATAVGRTPNIAITLDASILGFEVDHGIVDVQLDIDGDAHATHCALLLGADGVWSRLRTLVASPGDSVFTGRIAWRRTISASPEATDRLVPGNTVSVFLRAGFHMIAYPVRAGSEINLVAITPGPAIEDDWTGLIDPALLRSALAGADTSLSHLGAEAGAWHAYPIHTVSREQRWTFPGLALIGDAAHAMTPYAAQGAAMAIEDAETLAECLVDAKTAGWTPALAAWEAARRRRVDHVRKRGAFNQFAWHASGPIAVARDFILSHRSPESLAADMDWLYGFDSQAARQL